MSEPFLERLSRFTPSTGLDRDGLLYEAGRRSARPNRAWTASTSVLAVTQVLSLVLLWPRMMPQAEERTLAANGPSIRAGESAMSEPSASDARGSLWAARHNISESSFNDRSSAGEDAGPFLESEPPLKAFTPSAASLMN